MKQISYESKYIEEPVVLCLGTFDGMHIAHQQLIARGGQIAVAQGWKTAVYSFENIPANYLMHDTAKMNLFSRREKIAAFQQLNIDFLWLDFFDSHIATVSPEGYIRYLQKVLDIKHIVVGYDYTFGYAASGRPEDLERFGEEFGFSVTVIEPVMQDGEPVSSSKIREYLNDGEIIKANAMLGNPYHVSGTVVHGKKNGSKIGFPTINLVMEERKMLPKTGVYATVARIDGEPYHSVTNVGVRPTFFDNGELTIETHILDFERNLYGRFVTVEFLKFLSNETRLNDRNELKAKLIWMLKMHGHFLVKSEVLTWMH